MALKAVQGFFGYSSSSTPSAAQLESRNGVLLLPQDSVVIDENNRQGKKLGEGTFAKVYVGMYSGKDRAIKIFNGKSDSTVDKAWEEYEKLNSLKHPNIVRVYGMWKDPHKGRNAPAIVMELCDHSLHEYIHQYHTRGSNTRERKLKILHDITCAMVFLHSQNIVHGDLRSPNVLVNTSNDEVTAKLTDFGMARVLDPQCNSHVTLNVADCDYLPPEVFNHKEQRDRKKNWAKLTTQVDVFMFGPIAIELACGEFPKPTTKHEVRKGAVTRTYTEIERREQHLSKVKAKDRAITDVIVKECLAENPEDRGTFFDLQRIVKGFQRQKDQPGSADHFQDLYEEAQEELEGLRSQLEADQVSLYQQDVEQRLNEEKEQLKKDIEQLIEQIRKKDDEFTEFQTKCVDSETQLNKDLFQVKQERDQAQSSLLQKDNDWESLQAKFINLMTSFDALTKEHNNLKGKAEQGFNKKDLEISSLKLKCENTETQLTLKLSIVGDERDLARRDLELQKHERNTLLEDYNEKLKKFGDLTEEHEKLMLAHQRMQNEHTEEKEKLATEKTKELAKKQNHIKQLEAAVASGNTERTRLAAVQVTELEKLKTETDRMKKEHERSMALLNKEKTEDRLKSDEERHALQQENVALKTDLSAYQKEAASAGHITNLKDVCRRLKKELTAAELSKSDVINNLAQAKAELSRLRGFCQEKDGEIVKLKALTVQGDTYLEQLVKEKVELTESLTISQDQIPKKVHRELQNKFEALKTTSGRTDDELKAVKKQLQATVQQAETLQKQLNSSSHAKSLLEIDKISLLERVKRLENEQVRLKADETRLAALRVKHEGDLATIKTKEQELKKARDDMKTRDTAIKAHQETIRHLQVEVTKSKNSIQTKESELKKAKEDFQFREKQLKEAKANSSALKKLEKDIRDLQQKLLELEGVERQRNDLSDKLGSLRVEKESLEHKRGFLEADCTRLESEKRAVIEERDQLKKENDAQLRGAKDSLLQASHTEESLKASLKNVEDDLQQKERDFNHAKDSEQKLSEKIAELNESLGVKEAEIERLNAAIEEDRTAVEEAKDTVKIVHKYSREKTELNAKLKEAKEQSIKAEVLKLRIEELEKALKEARDVKRREEQTEATELDAREMTEKNEQVNRLEKVVAELQEHKMTVIKEKKLLEGELHAAVSARNARVRELSLLTEELKKVTKKAQMDHKEWEEKAAKLLKQEDFLHKAIDNTKSSLQQSLRKATALEKEKQNLMTNLQAAQQRWERLNIDYDHERKVASDLKADNARLTGELQKDKSASNKFRDEARKKRGALQQCIAVLQGHVKACKSDLDKAKKANSAEMAQYEDGIHSMKVQLKKKLTAVESESEVAIRRSLELTEENKQVLMESKDVHHANVMLRQTLLKLNEQALKAQGEVQRLEQLLQSRNKELDSVKDEIDNVTTQHQETLLTVEQLQDSLCTKKEELQAATENVSSLRTSLQERTDKCECLQSSLAEMSQQCQSLEARMQDLNGNVTTLEVERNMLSAGNDEIRRANKDLVDRLESRAVTIDDLMKDNASCHEKVQIAEGALSTCRDELAVKAEESRAQGITVDRLNEELHSKQERLTSLSSTILEKDDEIQTLQLHLRAANFVSAVVTSSLECSWGTDARRLQSAQKRCEELSVELSYKQQEFDTVCEELQIQKEKYGKAKDLTHELEDAQMQLQSESHHLQAAVEDLEKSRASMQGSHDELNDSFVSLEEENKSLSLSLEQLQIKYNAFKGEVASLSLQCGKAVAERHMIKAECDTVHRHMADIAAKNEELEQENKHLTKIKRTANQLKTKESELKSKEKNMMQLSQEADKREAMLKGREEAFDSKWQHLDVTRQLGRQQSLLQRKHEKFAKSFAATTTASLAGNRKVVEQMKREHLIVGKELQRDFVALKASLATELQDILCQSQGSLESRFESSAEKQLQTQQQVVEQVQGLLLKEIEKADTKSLTALSEHKAILHQIQETHQGMLDERTDLIKDLDCKRSQYERILRADQDKCGKKHLKFEVASLGDLMVPFVLTLPFSHAVTDPSNIGTCVPMKELSKVCALSGFEIASIGSLSPKCSGLLPPFHACCTRAVRHLVEKISQTFTTETFQVYSVGFLKSSDKVYMCRLLMAVVPRMLDFSEDKDLEPKILYTLARMPLLGKGKEEGIRDSYRDVLFEPKWYTGEPRTWAHTFLFQNFPSSLHHVSEQLELDMSRKLAESLREALSR